MATTTTRMSITLTSNPSTSASSPSASHNLIQSSPVNNKKRKRTSTKQQLRLDEPNLPESTPKQSNANRYPCDFKGCHKSYSKPSRLKEHQRVHTGERPFKCNHPDCQASYMRNSHLVAHKRTHLDSNAASAPTTSNQDQVQDEFSIRPFACDRQGCSQRFWTRQHLNRHVEGVHDDSRALEDQTQTETEVEVGGKDDDDGWMTNSSQSRKVSIGNGNDGSDLEGKKRRRRKRPGGEGAYKVSFWISRTQVSRLEGGMSRINLDNKFSCLFFLFGFSFSAQYKDVKTLSRNVNISELTFGLLILFLDPILKKSIKLPIILTTQHLQIQ